MSNKITLQRIFDMAWERFIVGDGEPAVGDGGTCSYCTTEGLKCAVGLALPEGHDSQGYIGSFDSLVFAYPELFDSEITGASAHFLESFQSQLHDSLADTNTGKWKFDKATRRDTYTKLAKDFGLTIPGEGNE